jgi:hypothetical protein
MGESGDLTGPAASGSLGGRKTLSSPSSWPGGGRPGGGGEGLVDVAVGSGDAPVGLVAEAVGGSGTPVGITVTPPWVVSTPLMLLD